MGREPAPHIRTLIRSAKVIPVTMTEAQLESILNVEELLMIRAELEPRVQSSLDRYRAQHRTSEPSRQLPSLDKVDCVLDARSDFRAGEKLCLF